MVSQSVALAGAPADARETAARPAWDNAESASVPDAHFTWRARAHAAYRFLEEGRSLQDCAPPTRDVWRVAAKPCVEWAGRWGFWRPPFGKQNIGSDWPDK